MTASNFGFETLPTHWRACAQDATLYGVQKSIELAESSVAPSAQFQQVQPELSTNSVAELWCNVFKSRSAALSLVIAQFIDDTPCTLHANKFHSSLNTSREHNDHAGFKPSTKTK